MVTKGILKMALAAEKGINFKKVKEQRKHKDTARRKRTAAARVFESSRDSVAKDAVDSKPEDYGDDEGDEDNQAEESGRVQNEEVSGCSPSAHTIADQADQSMASRSTSRRSTTATHPHHR